MGILDRRQYVINPDGGFREVYWGISVSFSFSIKLRARD